MPRFCRTLLLTAAALALAAIVPFAIACGDDEDEDGAATPAATRAGAITPASGATSAAPTAGAGAIDIADVPELEDGSLDIGSDVAYAPVEFFDENDDAVGLDVDIANALAEKLGVEVSFNNAGFDTLLPALDSQRYDIIMSAMTINAERLEVVDFIPYFNAGSGILVPAGNPEGIESVDDLCGKTVAAQKGTIQAELLVGTPDAPGGADQTCKDNGQDGITVREFDTDPEAVQALIAGQADAEMADFPVAAYSAQQSDGAIEAIPNQIDPAPYGIAVRKGSEQLKQALEAALDQIREDGTYDEILAKWDLASGAVE